MAELPSHPEVLCFSEYIKDFQDKDFHVDEFIGKCRKKVSIECLRQDLDSYYRTLKSAMVELINKDYADFVSLSSNLVGMDKSMNDLMTPLGQLQEEIMSIKVSMETAIRATESKLTQREHIRKDKETLQRLLKILESIEKLERLLKIRRVVGEVQEEEDEVVSEIERLASKSEFAAMVMERVASEFNQLQYNVKLTDHPIVDENTPRIHVITTTLQSKLEASFQSGLRSRDREVVTRCLQTYASISRCQAAESLFQLLVVQPYMEEVVSAKSLLAHADGLRGVYGDILRFIPDSCSLLLEVTRPINSDRKGGVDHGGGAPVKGFNFLVNSVWPEIVSVLERKASVIFAPGNPDTFHKNYTASMEFVASFEGQCHTPSSIKALRSHPSFNAFMSKWSLPVYFQIRFQDIAGTLESCLSLPLAPSPDTSDSTSPPAYQLELFCVLEAAIRRCWSEDVFISALVHRFWKLTLQLMVRVSVWLEEVAALPTPEASGSADDPSKSPPLPTCFKVIHDVELLHSKVNHIFTSVIERKLPQSTDTSSLQETLYKTSGQIQQLVAKFSSLITAGLSQLCMKSLMSANTLPRLYRRTNKETPAKPSAYIGTALKPLRKTMGDFPSHYRVQWSEQVVSEMTQRYFDIGSDLLTSVQRTEESLLKLKSYRKSLTPPTAGGMTDDNKIRLQLALDIEEFTVQVLTLHPAAMNISSFKKLLEMGQLAKTTALATPP